MQGLAEISGGAAWTAALPAVGALLVFALVLGIIAWALMRRKITA
jgi:ABC-type multidrug transport system permease subunit